MSSDMNFYLWSMIILVAAFHSTAAFFRASDEEIFEMFAICDVVKPIEVDERGNFLSYHLDSVGRRRRRDVRSSESSKDNDLHPGDANFTDSKSTFYLNISAFGRNYSIVLKRKTRLIAPHATTFQYSDRNDPMESTFENSDVYAGHVMNHMESTVAMTNFEGLAGFIKIEKEEFFIEPIEDRRESSNVHFPQRHVIYKSFNRFGSNATKSRTKRHAKGKVSYIEVLLTADDTVVAFHGSGHVRNYLVTLMNIVDEIYQDESIGHKINIVVVRMSLLSRAQSDNLIARADPAASLKNVCEWAYNLHHSDSGNPKATTYDHAIFLTRRNFGPIGMEGYAHVTGMCEPLRSCTLNHEDGFSSAFVVAHETGHVLGMEHDGEGNKCGDETSMGSIMAPLVQAAFHRYHWSRCSQYELKDNLRKFNCLQNDPRVSDEEETQEYPGVYYSLDDQCRFDFGAGYKQCTAFRNIDVCQTLWCSHDDNPMFCKTKNGPPVDGTECDENKWCFKSHCVWRDSRLGRVDGAWGEWNDHSLCSRSCGAGVMTRTRDCNRPRPAFGGSDCVGSRTDIALCNKQPCAGSYDYRAEQCRFHQKKFYENRRHTWLPFESENESFKCELYCMSKETSTILSMGMPVADGTRCSYDDPYSVCVNGECVKVGCDGVIGSAKREDDCGVCRGNGSQCRRINSTYRKMVRKPHNSYMKLFTIPIQSRRVFVREASADLSPSFALKNRRTGRYVLNQRGAVLAHDQLRQFIDAGTKWLYTKRRDREELRSLGPLKSEYIVLAVQKHQVRKIKVHYNYVLHSSEIEDSLFHFEIRKWYPCSVTCGEGTRLARYGCRNKLTKKWVRKNHCGSSPPRKQRKPCTVECRPQPRWNAERWSSCSISCGGSGTKTRSVTCQLQAGNESWERVDDEECNNLLTKPAETRSCLRETCPPEWSVGNWSLCSVSCGKGLQQRPVICLMDGRTVSDDECLRRRPVEAEPCEREACVTETVCKQDQSTFCKLSSMEKYCSIAGYRQLCCESCRARKDDADGD